MYKILIVEDDHGIADLLKLNLEMYGFSVDNAYDGQEGFDFINRGKYDLIVLDLMMPIYTGYDLLPRIQEKDTPVILLTAKDTLDAKIKCFSLGADDFMTKPFEAVELIARINAVLKRSNNKLTSSNYEFDDICVDMEIRQVKKNSKVVELTIKEFELLGHLVENRGIALSRELLLDRVWNYSYIGNTRTIDTHIQKLRSKLDTDRIKTVYKYGYRFEK